MRFPFVLWLLFTRVIYESSVPIQGLHSCLMVFGVQLSALLPVEWAAEYFNEDEVRAIDSHQEDLFVTDKSKKSEIDEYESLPESMTPSLAGCS